MTTRDGPLGPKDKTPETANSQLIEESYKNITAGGKIYRGTRIVSENNVSAVVDVLNFKRKFY